MKISSYKKKIQELEEELEDQRGIITYRDKEISNHKKNIENLIHEKMRLELRLEACLYAMILMQANNRVYEDYCKENHMEKPKLAV